MQRMLFLLEFLQRKPWLVTVFGVLVMLWLAYSMFFSQHGLPSYLNEVQQLKVLRSDLQQVQAEREDLNRRARLLREDRTYLETVIHRELGYVYPDEMILVRKASP